MFRTSPEPGSTVKSMHKSSIGQETFLFTSLAAFCTLDFGNTRLLQVLHLSYTSLASRSELWPDPRFFRHPCPQLHHGYPVELERYYCKESPADHVFHHSSAMEDISIQTELGHTSGCSILLPCSSSLCPSSTSWMTLVTPQGHALLLKTGPIFQHKSW